MSAPRSIEVHIEELLLHGFEPRSRWNIADALESELHSLLSQRGVPPAWFSNPERIDGGAVPAVRLMNAKTAGQEIAGAVHKGGRK